MPDLGVLAPHARLRKQVVGGGWVLDADIRKFFDSLDPAHLREILATWIRDGVITRLIGKRLNAGVWEIGPITHPDSGSAQGGVISPLLSNIYGSPIHHDLPELHDRWPERWFHHWYKTGI